MWVVRRKTYLAALDAARKDRADMTKMLDHMQETLRLHEAELDGLRVEVRQAINEAEGELRLRAYLQSIIRESGDTATALLKRYWGKNAPAEPIVQFLTRAKLDGFCMPTESDDSDD